MSFLPPQQWKAKNDAEGGDGGEKQDPVQHPAPRHQRRGGRQNRPDRSAGRDTDAGEQQVAHKDQKDQLTWQQKKLLS